MSTPATQSSLAAFCETSSLSIVRDAYALSMAVQSGDPQAVTAANEALIANLTSFSASNEAQAGQDAIAEACDIYASDKIEIDGVPLLSEADGGTWVSAWVWVKDQNQDEDQDQDEDDSDPG